METTKSGCGQNYRSCAGVTWVNDTDCLLVVQAHPPTTHELHGPDAALWRWLHLGYVYPQVLALYAALLNVPSQQGERHLQETLQRWTAAGLLEAAGG